MRKLILALGVFAWAGFLVAWLAPRAWLGGNSLGWVLLALAVGLSAIAGTAHEKPVGRPIMMPITVRADRALRGFDGKYAEYFGASDADGPTPLEKLVARMGDRTKGVVRSTIELEFLRTHLSIKHSQTLDLSPPGEILPVHRMVKGTIAGERTVRAEGREVVALSRLECHGAALRILQVLAGEVATELHFPHDWYRRAVLKTVRAVSRETEGSREAVKAAREAVWTAARKAADTAALESGETPSEDDLGLKLEPLLSMIAYLAKYHTVMVTVPHRSKKHLRRIVVTEYQRPNRDVVRRALDRFRYLLGLEQRDFNLALPEALESPSLHVHCKAPPGMYVFSAVPFLNLKEILDTLPPAARTVVCPRGAPPPPWIEETRGFDYVHAYFHELNDLRARLKSVRPKVSIPLEARLVVSFRERPPGSMLILAVASVFLSAMVILTGRNFHDFFATDPRVTLALIYGLPALFAGWIVARIKDEVLRRISIPTFLNAAWFVVNAGVAIGIVAVFVVVGSDHPRVWFALTMSCVAQMLVTLFRYWIKHYRHIVRLHVSNTGEPFRSIWVRAWNAMRSTWDRARGQGAHDDRECLEGLVISPSPPPQRPSR